MKNRFLCLLLAGTLLLGLTSCAPPPADTLSPSLSPEAEGFPVPTTTPTPEPFVVQAADVPPGDYEPWQEAYMDYLTELCEREAPLRRWAREATKEEIEADPQRAGAVNNCSNSYFLYDVDKNEIPELFIQYGDYYIPWIECYTYREGKVTQIGKLSGEAKGSYFCTWPGKNAILNYWAWKGAFILWEYSIVNGELVCMDEDGIASQFGGPGEPDPRDYVPGTLYLEPHRIRTARPEDAPMLLPICAYGGREVTPATEEARRTVREAIEGVLYHGQPFYGVPGEDYYYGDTGWITLEEYCQEGVVESYDTLTPSELVWLDLNGDGTEECVVRFLNERSYNSGMTVFSWQDDTVYGYYIDSLGWYGVTAEGAFYVTDPLWVLYEIGVKKFVFYQNQCYFETVSRPEEMTPVIWSSFSSVPPTP